MNIQNIFWEVNRTLFDTYPAVTYSVSKALSGMGVSVALNVIDGLVRQSFDDGVDALTGRFKLDPSLFRRQFWEFYRTIPPANEPPFPDVREVCEFIHQNSGLNLAFTDSSLDSARRLIEAHQFSSLIDELISLERAHPETPGASRLSAALEKHGLDPTKTLFIGSRTIDIQAGQSVGVRTCLFRKAELTNLADIHIEQYSQLLELLTTEKRNS